MKDVGSVIKELIEKTVIIIYITCIAIIYFLGRAFSVYLSYMQTRSANKSQDYEKARRNSSYTKIFNGIAIAIGIFLWIIVTLSQAVWISFVVILTNLQTGGSP